MANVKGEKNTVIEVEIDNLGINGEGVARYNGKAVFIKNALVGEKVRAKIIFSKPTFCVAIVQERLSTSSQRQPAQCPIFTKCGGCNIQHLDYGGQLEFKKQLVQDALQRIGGLDVKVNDCVASDKQFRYRNKMSLPIRRDGDVVKVGLFAENSHRIVECDDCILQPEWNKTCIKLVKQFIQKERVSVYSDEDKKGKIRHLVVRQVEGCLFVTVVATTKIKLDAFAQDLAKSFDSFALFLNVNAKDNNVILGDVWYEITSRNVPEKVGDLIAQIHPAGFFQVNDYIKNQIYSKAVEEVNQSGASVVIDAYSGAGIMSAFFARFVDKVYAIEINEQAHASCEKIVKDNKIANLYPILGDVKDKIGDVLAHNRTNKTTVVLDPPRSGCNQNVLQAIVDSNIENVVYISCNPATLARDLKFLKDYYLINSVTPFDMFPQTSNVETLVCLSHKNGKTYQH